MLHWFENGWMEFSGCVNERTTLRWRCIDGHDWEAVPLSEGRGVRHVRSSAGGACGCLNMPLTEVSFRNPRATLK